MLYADNERHQEIINELMLNQCNSCDYVGILHDKDVNEDGTPKKEHYHVVICCSECTSMGQIQTRFPNLESNLIEKINDRREALRYLTHITEKAKEEHKYLYEQSLLFGSPRLISKAYTKDATSELENILNYIELSDRSELCYTKLLQWCIEQNCHNTLRKYSYLIKEVMSERLCKKTIITKGVFGE